MDEWAMVRQERAQLADLLATLSPDQWEAPSLCEGWKVRDVVGHLIQGNDLKLGPGLILDLIKSGFNFNKLNAEAARNRAAGLPPDRLVADFLAGIDSRSTPPGLGPLAMLVDVFTHTNDIRRPLALPPLPVPEADLRAIADHAKTLGFPIGAKKRIAGLRLRATDLDWSTGEGPEVTGPLEALIMAMMGRRAALDDLAGEGKAELARRL